MQTPNRWGVIAILSLMAAGLPAATIAMSLAEAQALAREHDPELERLAAEIRAAESRAVAAGELPDPKLRLGAMNVPVPGFSLSDEPMAQLQLGISQRFPASAARDAARAVEHSRADKLEAQFSLRQLQLDREVRDAWLELQYEIELLDVEERRGEVLDQLVEALGTGQQADRIYQTEVLSGSARRARLERSKADRRARISQLRAVLAERLDPAPLPQRLAPARIEAPEAVTTTDHPAIRLAQQAVEQADRAVMAARAAFEPGWEAGFGVGQRFGNTPMGAPSETLVSATISIDLPLFTRKRQSMTLEAARASRSAAETEPVATRRNLQARAESAAERHRDYARLAESYRQEVIELLHEREQAESRRYGNNRQSLEAVLEARLARLDGEAEHVELERARDLAASELLYMGGQ